MPERLYSIMNLHDADVDNRVPSLDIELEESNVDRDIANRVQRIHLVSDLSLVTISQHTCIADSYFYTSRIFYFNCRNILNIIVFSCRLVNSYIAAMYLSM